MCGYTHTYIHIYAQLYMYMALKFKLSKHVYSVKTLVSLSRCITTAWTCCFPQKSSAHLHRLSHYNTNSCVTSMPFYYIIIACCSVPCLFHLSVSL